MTPAGGPDPRAVADDDWIGCDPLENGYSADAAIRSYRDRCRDLAAALAAPEERAAAAEVENARLAGLPDEARILARRVLTWFEFGDDRSTFPPALLNDLRAAAQVRS